MKKARLLAASATVLSGSSSSSTSSVLSGSSSSSTSSFTCNSNLKPPLQENLPSTPDPKQGYSSLRGSASANSFEPQFDGLRFIQTLVTGHCSQMILERSNSKCPVFCRCGYLSLLSSSSQWKKN